MIFIHLFHDIPILLQQLPLHHAPPLVLFPPPQLPDDTPALLHGVVELCDSLRCNKLYLCIISRLGFLMGAQSDKPGSRPK